ncbi:MAG: Antitoxin [Myxococcales bacterium]|nr:Antitoxin [Myxococcales bacterium]
MSLTCTFLFHKLYTMDRPRKPRQKKTQRWSVAEARAKLPRVFAAAAHEPQAVYRHDTPVAIVVSPRAFAALEGERLDRQRETLADAFAALRALDAGRIVAPPRRNRPNSFARAGR